MCAARPEPKWKTDPELPTPPSWKREAREAARQHGYGWRNWLASEIQCSNTAITKLFMKSTKTSKLVLEVCRVLKIDPSLPAADLEEQAVLAAFRRGRVADGKTASEMARRFVAALDGMADFSNAIHRKDGEPKDR